MIPRCRVPFIQAQLLHSIMLHEFSVESYGMIVRRDIKVRLQLQGHGRLNNLHFAPILVAVMQECKALCPVTTTSKNAFSTTRSYVRCETSTKSVQMRSSSSWILHEILERYVFRGLPPKRSPTLRTRRPLQACFKQRGRGGVKSLINCLTPKITQTIVPVVGKICTCIRQ